MDNSDFRMVNNPIIQQTTIRQILLECWMMCNRTILVVTPTHAYSKLFSNELWNEEKDIPDWVKSQMTRTTISVTEFINGSKIILATHSNHFKGLSVDKVYIHNHIKPTEEFWYNVIPCIRRKEPTSIQYFE